MKSFLLKKILPSLLMVAATTVYASAQGDPDTGGPRPDPNPVNVPVDGGVSLLLAGGLAYGVKHLRTSRRKA